LKIAIAGTGYVGLVTGVCLSEIGHHVTCIDTNQQKIDTLQKGISPIYEPGLEELLKKNMAQGRLYFTVDPKQAYSDADIIMIAVGTPENEDGSANLTYVEQAAETIACHIEKDVIVVTKSTVPVGTNENIKQIIERIKPANVHVEVASNPEFLREGSAIYDTFNGDRIVIGAENDKAAKVLEELYQPLGIPVVKTDIRSAEMIKYASNAFLATKISFINEIANICEKVGANIDDVSYGIGLDGRIGLRFLQAGIGYGGSCFPKDTKALVQLAGNVQHQFELLEAVIKVNNHQQSLLVQKAKKVFGSLRGKRAALLGLSFKPKTDDVREAASLVIARQLSQEGVSVIAYDPIAVPNAKRLLGNMIDYTEQIETALAGADMAFIVTEWETIKTLPLQKYCDLMNNPVIFDGRNCYSLKEAEQYPITYISIGRREIIQREKADVNC
jgi:UDPglucose 6-dehydrogenase